MERNYKSFVGAIDKYDIIGAQQFSILVELGMRDFHKLLDVGCGSLRSGRFTIPYLLEGNYFGIEPEAWLLREGIEKETGKDLIQIKKPTFSHNRDFDFEVFGTDFDFILFHSIFSHTSRAQLETCFAGISKVMKSDGIALATHCEKKSYIKSHKKALASYGIDMSKDPENYEADSWAYPDCAFYTQGYLRTLAKKYGLELSPLLHKHPNGQRWFTLKRK